jgi:hypothetical protein
MTKTISRAGLGAVLALGLLAAPAAFAEEGKTSGSAAGSTAEPSSKGGGSADKSVQENAASADKAKQQGASGK